MLARGDVFAGHLIDEHVGGAVYRALQVSSERTVALKLATAPPSFAHPNAVEVLAAGDGWFAMRWVAGPTLAEVLPLEAGHARAIAGQLAAALEAAHAAGVTHGAIEPSNVLLEGDHAYLGDFRGGGTPEEDRAALQALFG